MTADLALARRTTASDVADSTSLLETCVDAVQVVDDRHAVGHMSSLVAASIVLDNGCDAVLHLTCRDRNRLALHGDLLGAAALGVTSVVLERGEKLQKDDYIRGKGVFDTRTDRLIAMAAAIGDDPKLVSPPGFLIGGKVMIFRPPEEWRSDRIQEMVRAGVRVLYTQPCLNIKLLSRYVHLLVEQRVTHGASLIVEVPLITSADAAQNYKVRHPGSLIPKRAANRIAEATDPRAEGIAVCAEMLAAVRDLPGTSGANVRHDGDPRGVIEAIGHAGLGRDSGGGSSLENESSKGRQ